MSSAVEWLQNSNRKLKERCEQEQARVRELQAKPASASTSFASPAEAVQSPLDSGEEFFDKESFFKTNASQREGAEAPPADAPPSAGIKALLAEIDRLRGRLSAEEALSASLSAELASAEVRANDLSLRAGSPEPASFSASFSTGAGDEAELSKELADARARLAASQESESRLRSLLAASDARPASSVIPPPPVTPAQQVTAFANDSELQRSAREREAKLCEALRVSLAAGVRDFAAALSPEIAGASALGRANAALELFCASAPIESDARTVLLRAELARHFSELSDRAEAVAAPWSRPVESMVEFEAVRARCDAAEAGCEALRRQLQEANSRLASAAGSMVDSMVDSTVSAEGRLSDRFRELQAFQTLSQQLQEMHERLALAEARAAEAHHPPPPQFFAPHSLGSPTRRDSAERLLDVPLPPLPHAFDRPPLSPRRDGDGSYDAFGPSALAMSSTSEEEEDESDQFDHSNLVSMDVSARCSTPEEQMPAAQQCTLPPSPGRDPSKDRETRSPLSGETLRARPLPKWFPKAAVEDESV